MGSIIITETHIWCMIFITFICLLLALSGRNFINRVFENIGNIINGKKLKKILSDRMVPSTAITLNLVQLIRNMRKLEENEIFVLIGILLGGIISVIYFLYHHIHRKIKSELEYPYNKRESFPIFMTLFASVLLYKWSKRCPSREDTEYNQELIEKRSVVSPKLIDDILVGKYGDGLKRQRALENMGYDYRTVQDMVTEEYYRRKENSSYKVNDRKSSIIEKLKKEDSVISSGLTEDMLSFMIDEVMEDLVNIKGRK